MTKHDITRADIIPMTEYAKIRIEKRKALVETKRNRRVEIGPFACFYFESYETMWMQIHEMLYIERGGEEQIEDELRAYSPLVPKGNELVATVMFEIDDPIRRKSVLTRLGGVEHTMSLQFAGETITAVPEQDVERTNAEGKASSVHFMHFPFTREQIEKFRQPRTQVIVGIGHEGYAHMAVMAEVVRQELAKDFA